MTPNVYIINDSGHDFSAAEHFGNLVRLSYGTVPKFETTEIIRKVLPVIARSAPDDFIIHSGPTVMFMLTCVLFALQHKKLNLLVFNGRVYKTRSLDFGSIFDHVEEWKEEASDARG